MARVIKHSKLPPGHLGGGLAVQTIFNAPKVLQANMETMGQGRETALALRVPARNAAGRRAWNIQIAQLPPAGG